MMQTDGEVLRRMVKRCSPLIAEALCDAEITMQSLILSSSIALVTSGQDTPGNAAHFLREIAAMLERHPPAAANRAH